LLLDQSTRFRRVVFRAAQDAHCATLDSLERGIERLLRASRSVVADLETFELDGPEGFAFDLHA
jgi:hypothetical protein